ncbi:hypothetical protein DdX_19494 [Ditylenchus destructor]|uniref:Uncharacterized protein n=1 Tax=Ditylenchus destructor TaxID=166010 RepID=A0AAD4MJC0_9BILA|nr:hypothetical protein DdX_19494 [Ditylenchus destructor]
MISTCRTLTLVGRDVIQWLPHIPLSDTLEYVSLSDCNPVNGCPMNRHDVISDVRISEIVEFLFKPSRNRTPRNLVIRNVFSYRNTQAIVHAMEKGYLVCKEASKESEIKAALEECLRLSTLQLSERSATGNMLTSNKMVKCISAPEGNDESPTLEGNWRVEHTVIKRFNKELSPEEYKQWVVRNKYSKHTSLKISTTVDPLGYELSAYGDYKDRNPIRTPVFFARVKQLNHDTWPLFQHFVRLLTDPFICIRYLRLITQADVFNLLAAKIHRSNRGRLHCEILSLKFEGNVQTPLNWIKDHVRCASFQQSMPVSNCSPNRRKQLLDFFITGSHCTSEIVVIDSNISKDLIIDFVQKFTHLKNCDEIHIVNSIRGKVFYMSADALDTIYEQFIIKNEKNRRTTAQVFEFVNVVIQKKLQLSITRMGNASVIGLAKNRGILSIVNKIKDCVSDNAVKAACWDISEMVLSV